MADYINNVAAGDQYTPACSLGPDYAAKYAVITIANNPALMQFAIGVPGNWRWTDEREFQSIPQSFRVGGVIGLRVRNASPGNVARVLAVLAGDDDPDFQSGVPFTGVLAAGGGVTPGGATVEIDHNGVAISTQPKVDFEDNGAFIWTIVDDPAGTRAKVIPPQFVTGVVAAAGGVFSGSGFASVRNAAGNYTITFNPAFPTTPLVFVQPENTVDVVSRMVQLLPGSFTVQFNNLAGVATDTAFHFFALPEH